MTLKKAIKLLFIDQLIYYSAWFTGYLGTTLLFSSSHCYHSYGLLSGWWCALFISYLFRIQFYTLIPLIITYLCIVISSYAFDFNWFYRDPPTEFSIFFLLILFAQSLLFVSPLLVTLFIRYSIKQRNYEQ